MLREKQAIQLRFQQELLQTQIEIQEQTLKTISQEIHDNVGQILSLAKLNLNIFPAANDEQQTKINDTKQLVSKAIIDLRNLSRSMYGDQLNELGLNDAIANELSIIRNTGQFNTAANYSRAKNSNFLCNMNWSFSACCRKPSTTSSNMQKQKILKSCFNTVILHLRCR
ncbi:MAG: histidine kinase [Ferruginibacter sp.]